MNLRKKNYQRNKKHLFYHNYFWFNQQFILIFLQLKGVVIGAMLDLFLGKRKVYVLYGISHTNLIFWGRYVNDVLLLWSWD